MNEVTLQASASSRLVKYAIAMVGAQRMTPTTKGRKGTTIPRDGLGSIDRKADKAPSGPSATATTS